MFLVTILRRAIGCGYWQGGLGTPRSMVRFRTASGDREPVFGSISRTKARNA